MQHLEKTSDDDRRAPDIITDQFKTHQWYHYDSIRVKKCTMIKGVKVIYRGGGAGTNQRCYERAASLALALAVRIEHQYEEFEDLQPLVDHIMPMYESVFGRELGTSAVMKMVDLPPPGPVYDPTVPDWE